VNVSDVISAVQSLNGLKIVPEDALSSASDYQAIDLYSINTTQISELSTVNMSSVDVALMQTSIDSLVADLLDFQVCCVVCSLVL
jgi:hypothetical protein